jgi:YD repeat-containing protein
MGKTNYDASNNVIGRSEKDGNKETHYDKSGNKIGSSQTEGSGWTNEYDNGGNLTGYSRKDGEWTTRYDKSLNKDGYTRHDGNTSTHYDSGLNKTGSSDSGSNGGGCFISSACISGIGLADDCPELQSLRFFRDNYLRQSKEGQSLIDEYYRIAPEILKAIEKRGDSRQLLNELFWTLVKPTVDLIASGKNEDAVAHYRDYVLQLKNTFGC